MIKYAIIAVIILLLIGAGIFAVYHFWLSQPGDVTPGKGEESVPIVSDADEPGADLLGDISEPEESFGVDPLSEDTGSRALEAPETIADPVETPSEASLEEPLDLSLGNAEPEILGGTPEDASPVVDVEPTPVPAETPRREEQPVAITVERPTSEAAPEPTAAPKTMAATSISTPVPAQTAGDYGDYSVNTLNPVFESKLPAIRTAMKKLGVKLQEQRAGRQQNIQAYRVAIGYFRTKAEATSWAQNYLRSRKIDYFVYPVQRMYSIQVGVYTQQQNVEKKMRELYQKFPGWRLPVRNERTMIAKASYHLSINKITEALGRNIQNTLVRMGVQAQLAGI